MARKKEAKKDSKIVKAVKKSDYPTLRLVDEKEIAMDFAKKIYLKFDKMIKSVVLFGSTVKATASVSSDIDIIVILDDVSIQWDEELTVWYREELGKIIQANPYKKELHINTVKLSTWWQDLINGDPVVINVIRYGETLLDMGGYFNPLKVLLQQGKIKSTPEAIYTLLQRAPQHMARSRASEMGAVEGLYWAMVDSAHAALMTAKQIPPSPEHVSIMLKEQFVDKGLLKMNYVTDYRDLYVLHRRIVHGDITNLKGAEIDIWQEKTDNFVRAMAEIIKKLIR